MATRILLRTAVLTALVLCGTFSAQGQDVFGGQGIRLGGSSQAAPVGTGYSQSLGKPQQAATETSSPGMFGQRSRVSPFKKVEFPKWRMPQIKLPSFRKPEGGNRLEAWRPGAMTNWMPQRDPDAPSAWDKFNAKSRDMFEKTKGWFKRPAADDGVTTWDALKKDMEQEQAQRRIGSGIRPSVRAARGTSDPSFRY